MPTAAATSVVSRPSFWRKPNWRRRRAQKSLCQSIHADRITAKRRKVKSRHAAVDSARRADIIAP